MKFITDEHVIKTNNIMNDLSIDEGLPNIVEVEVYSCKSTKYSKKYKNIEKPLKFLLQALDEHFKYYVFIDRTISDFEETNFKSLIEELNYIVMTVCKNSEDCKKVIIYWTTILKSVINPRKALIFKYYFGEDPKNSYFLLYDEEGKKVVLVKVGNTFTNGEEEK